MSAVNNRVAFRVVRDVRQTAFEHLQRLPLSYLDAHPAGETVSRVIADVDTFCDGLLLGFTQLFSGVLTILGTLFFMCSACPPRKNTAASTSRRTWRSSISTRAR